MFSCLQHGLGHRGDARSAHLPIVILLVLGVAGPVAAQWPPEAAPEAAHARDPWAAGHPQGLDEALVTLHARTDALDEAYLSWLAARHAGRGGLERGDLARRAAIGGVIVQERSLIEDLGARRGDPSQGPPAPALFQRLEALGSSVDGLLEDLGDAARGGRSGRGGRRGRAASRALKEACAETAEALALLRERCLPVGPDRHALLVALRDEASGFEAGLAELHQSLLLALGTPGGSRSASLAAAMRGVQLLRGNARLYAAEAERAVANRSSEGRLDAAWARLSEAMRPLFEDATIAGLANHPDRTLSARFRAVQESARRLHGLDQARRGRGPSHAPPGGIRDWDPVYAAARRLEGLGDAAYERARSDTAKRALPYARRALRFPFVNRSNWRTLEERFRELAIATDGLRDAVRELREHQEHAHGQADALRAASAAWRRAEAALGRSDLEQGVGVRPAYDRFLARLRGQGRYADGVAWLDREMTPLLTEMATQIVEIGRSVARGDPRGGGR